MNMRKWIEKGSGARYALVGAGAIVLMALLLRHSGAALEAGRATLTIWFNNVFPALLPFFVLIAIVTQSGLPAMTASAFRGLMRLVRLPGECAVVVLLGGLSGYPAGARLAGDLLSRGVVDRAECERLLLLCSFPGPMFVMGSVAAGMLGRSELGVPILLSQYAAAIVLSLVWARFAPRDRNQSTDKPAVVNKPALAALLSEAVGDGVFAMLRVAGFMLIASALCATLEASGVIDAIAIPLARHWPATVTHATIAGLFEMSNGCTAIAKLDLSAPVLAGLCAFVLGFGGLSVLLQTLHFASVRAGTFALAKLIQGAVAGGICFAWVRGMAVSAPVFVPMLSPQKQSTASLLICGVVLGSLWLGNVCARASRNRPREKAIPIRRP